MGVMTEQQMAERGLIEEGHMYGCTRAEGAHADGRKPRVFMNEHDKARADWHAVSWTDANGVEHPMLLCPECWGKYQSVEKSHQRDMYDFENEGIL